MADLPQNGEQEELVGPAGGTGLAVGTRLAVGPAGGTGLAVGTDPAGGAGLAGGTGLAVGTAALGGLYDGVSDDDGLATLHTALARGVTHFDSAPHYGRGLAEQRLGAFLGEIDGAPVTISTKVGRRIRTLDERPGDDIFLGAPPGESIFDFSPQGIRDELAGSRRRLQRDYLDVVLLHDPDDHLDEVLVASEELIRQREQGRIGAIGVGTNSAETAHRMIDRLDLDVILLAGRITLLDDSGESVAARCADLGIALFAAGVFQSGILAGDPRATFDYAPAGKQVLRRVRELDDLCRSEGVSLHNAALNHARRFRGVTKTLVGVRSADEMNLAADAFAHEPSKTFWTKLDSLREHQRAVRNVDSGQH